MSLYQVAANLGSILIERGLTICTAESCTGGLIANAITDIPGSSRYFVGAIVAYSNDVKSSTLGVPASYLHTFGAVSAPVALAMARAARLLLGADIAISTTGIAGPTGATSEKPIGLTYIALVAPGHASCHRYLWPHDRLRNKTASATKALDLTISLLAPKKNIKV